MDHTDLPFHKDWNRSFEITSFSTEWDGWCEHKFDIIDKKFGPLPTLQPLSKTHWWRWNEQAVNEVLQKHPVVRLTYGSRNEHIQTLFDACAITGEPRVVISDTNIPQPHPENVRVISTQPLAYQFSRTLIDKKTKPIYHRKVKDLKHPFFIMAKGNDFGRPKLMLMLEQLSLLKDALYSVGQIDAVDNQFLIDDIGVNRSLKDLPDRTLGGEYIKYDVKKNLELLPHLINQCHFYASLDTNGLYGENLLYPVNEKTLWGYCTTVPTLPIWYDNIAEQMKGWGYRFTNTRYRTPGESIQDTVVRWSKEILFHYHITQNDIWSQSWQDARGEDAMHNYELTLDLHRVIMHSVEQQLSELPPEFKRN
jgi:hypothetical protein